MNEKDLYDDNKQVESETSVQPLSGNQGVSAITANTGLTLGYGTQSSRPKAQLLNNTVDNEDAESAAKDEALLQVNNNVARVNDSLEKEDFVSTQDLYKKTLGVTHYDELRSKLHLKEDESFTDYYERTGYIPDGYELDAQMLLAEEKRKKLYAQYKAGEMGESTFLYEAYGKDLLKEQGIDFSNSLYWYNRYKQGDYSDPRKNDVFMLQLEEDSRELFEQEKWYADLSTYSLGNSLANFVTGEKLSDEDVYTIFKDQFDILGDYFDSRSQIIKYYRAGFLQGTFDPLIRDENGMVTHYYSPDGKLYNVSESGEGANTMKIYYNKDKNGNIIFDENGMASVERIVNESNLALEGGHEFLKGFLGLFTDVADLVVMAGGFIWDVGEGLITQDWELDKTVEGTAFMNQLWNGTFLGDNDYITESGFKNSVTGEFNTSGAVRQISGIAGSITAMIATFGIAGAVGGASKATTTTAGQLTKKGVSKAVTTATKKTVISKIGTGLKKVGKFGINTAVRMTGWANGIGAAQGTVGAVAKNAATTAFKDALNGAVNLTVNSKLLYANGVIDHEMTPEEILGKGLAAFSLEFGAGFALRSAMGTQALDRYKGIAQGIKDGSITGLPTLMKYSPQLLKITTNSLKTQAAVGGGNMLMDGVDNILTTWIQTSYTTKGELFDFDSLKTAMNNPGFWFNMLYQTKENYKDNFSISDSEIAAFSINSAKLVSNTRGWIQKLIADNVGTDNYAKLKPLMTDFDNLVKTETAKTGSVAAGGLSAVEQIVTKLELDSDLNIPKSITDVKQLIETKTVSEMNPLELAIHDAYITKSNLTIEYTKAAFEYINHINDLHNALGNNIFKKAGFRILYGKDAKNISTSIMQKYMGYLAADDRTMDWEAGIMSAFERTDLYNELADSLGEDGSEIVKALNDTNVAMGRMVQNKKGKWEIEGGLKDALKDNPEAYNKYIQYVTDRINKGEANATTSDIYILARNTGTSQDADPNRQDGFKFLAVVKDLMDLLSPNEDGSNDLIEKFGDAYVIKFQGLGTQFATLEQVRGMVQALAVIKLNTFDVDKNADSNKVSQAFKTLLGYLTETKVDADTVFDTDDSAAIVSQIINLLLNQQAISYTASAQLIESMNTHLSFVNANKKSSPKSLPVYNNATEKGRLTGNLNTSVDMTAYQKAQQVLDAQHKVTKAIDVINELKVNKKGEIKGTNKLTASQLSALNDCKQVLGNETIRDILVKEKFITDDFVKVINPFTQGLTDSYQKKSLTKEVSSQSSLSEDQKKKVQTIIIDSLGGHYVGEKFSRTDSIDITVKDKPVKIVLARMTKGNSFTRFVQAIQGSKALKNLEAIGIKIGTHDDIKSVVYFDNIFESLVSSNKLQAGTKEYNELESTIKGLKENYQRYIGVMYQTLIQTYEGKLNQSFEPLFKEIAAGFKNKNITAAMVEDAIMKPSDSIDKLPIFDLTNQDADGSIISLSKLSKYIQDHRVSSKYEDAYEETHRKFEILNKHGVILSDSEYVIIRLNEFFGPEWLKAAKKLTNPDVASRITDKGNNISAIEKEMFSEKGKFAFDREYNKISDLIEEYGDEIVITKDTAIQLFKDIGYHFQGELEYSNTKSIPGVYYVRGQQGMVIGDLKLLNNLSAAIPNISKKRSKRKVTVKDPLITADVYTGAISYITPQSTVDIKDVILKPISDDSTKEAYAKKHLEKLITFFKEGKAAAKSKDAPSEYTAVTLSNYYNDTHRAIIYTHNIIKVMSQFVSDDSESPMTPLQIVVPVQKGKAVSTQKNSLMAKYQSLWNVNIDEKTEPGYFIINIARKNNFNPGETFESVAFDLIKSKGITTDTLDVIIPNNRDAVQRNIINAKGTGASTLSGSQTPLSYIYTTLVRDYNLDEKFLMDSLLTNVNINKIDISNNMYDSAIKLTEGKTVQEILDITSDNVFLHMIQDSLKEDLKISNLFKEYVTKSFESYSLATQNNLVKLLGSEDMRRNIGSVLRTILKDSLDKSTGTSRYFDEDGNLLITDELINTILSHKHLKTSKVSEDFSVALADKEALKGYISLLSINTYTKYSHSREEDSIEEKLYAAVRSATSKSDTESCISYQDLSDKFTDSELDQLNSIITKYGGEAIPQEILDVIKEMPSRTKDSQHYVTEYRLEQAESIQNTYATSRGTIIHSSNYTGEGFKLTNKVIQDMVKAANKSSNGSNYIKLSEINTKNYSDDIMLKRTIERTKAKGGLINYIEYPASIMRANFNKRELLYRALNNMSNFASELHKYKQLAHLSEDTLADIAMQVYDLTTGTEMQSFHPDFMLIDTKTGKVIDVTEIATYTEDTTGALVGSILKNDTPDKHIVILKLNRNSLNTLYGQSVAPIELYDLERNREAIVSMIQYRRNKIMVEEDLDPKQSDLITKKTSEYFAKEIMKSPKFYSDQLYAEAKKLGINEKAITDFIGATAKFDYTSNRRTAKEEALHTLMYGSADDEESYYELQQLRNINSYGETDASFKDIEGIKEAISNINESIEDTLTIRETYPSSFKNILKAFREDDMEKVSVYTEVLRNKLSSEDALKLNEQLVKAFIMEEDSIGANIFKLTSKSIEDAIKAKDNKYSNIILTSFADGTPKDGKSYKLDELKNRGKFFIDIERFYKDEDDSGYIYQIAFVYTDSKGNEHKGVVYDRTDGTNLEIYKDKYPEFFKTMTGEGTQKSLAFFSKKAIDTNEVTFDEFLNLLVSANNEGALLIGKNSNKFDVPRLLESEQFTGKLDILKSMEHLDVEILAKRLPTEWNIDQFNNKLKLEKLLEQMGYKINDAHNGLDDVLATRLAYDSLVNNAIKQDSHANKFINDITKLWSAITGSEDMTDIKDLKIDSTIDSTLLKSLKDIEKRSQDPEKLYKFAELRNLINYKAMNNYYNIRRKEIESDIRQHNLSHAVAFASKISNKVIRDEVVNIISFALSNIKSSKIGDDSIQSKLPVLTNLLHDAYEVKFLNDKQLIEKVFSDHAKLKEIILASVGKSEEDFKIYKDSKDKYDLEGQLKTIDITAKDLALDQDLYKVRSSIEPFDKLVEDNLLSSIKDKELRTIVAERYNDALLRFISKPSDKENNLKNPRYVKNNIRNLFSNIHEDYIDYLKSSPLTSTSFKSIYELAQTTMGEVKIERDGNTISTRVKNDTIYLSKDTLENLMNEKGLDIQAFKELYSYKDPSGESHIYLPVIRHPRDMADNLHFLKIEILADGEPYKAVMNIDTMKSKFNGDFDGDHITILQPRKLLNEYAYTVNNYKNLAYGIFDTAFEDVITNSKFNNLGMSDTNFSEYSLRNNKTLIKKIHDDMIKLNSYEGNIIEEYNKLRDAFILSNKKDGKETNKFRLIVEKTLETKSKSFVKIPKGEERDSLITDVLKQIYLVEPIELKSVSTTDGSSFVTYSDFIGLASDQNNVRAKTLFRNASLAVALTMGGLDSASGVWQKDLLKADYNNRFKDGVDLTDSAINLSRTSRAIIENNFDLFKSSLLKSIASNLKDYTWYNPITKILKAAKTVNDIEIALRLIQSYAQIEMKYSDEFKASVNNLKANTSDDPMVKAINRFVSGNESDFDDHLSEFIYSMDELEKIAGPSDYIARKKQKEGIGYLLDYAQKVNKRGIIRHANAGKEFEEIKDSMQTTVDTFYKVRKDNDQVNIIAEDTYLLCNGSKDYQVFLPKAVKLSDKDSRYIYSKYFTDKTNRDISNKFITDKKDLAMLGIKDSVTCQIKMGYQEQDGTFVIYRMFGLDTTKTGVDGNKSFKGTPAGYINLEGLPETLRDIVDKHFLYRDLTWFKGKNVTSHFQNKAVKCYDQEGKFIVEIKPDSTQPIPANTYYISTKEDLSVLEATPTWSKEATAESDVMVSNSLLDTGGIAQTFAMFVHFDENGNLYFDDKGHAEMMNRLFKLNEPAGKLKDSKELYELLQFAILSKYISEEDLDNYDSKEAYINKAMRQKSGFLRSELSRLKTRVSKDAFKKDSIEYKLLFDSNLENSVYEVKADVANENTELTTKGSAKTRIASDSSFHSEVSPGGVMKDALDIFNSEAEFSAIDLLNYLIKSQGSNKTIPFSSIIRLLEENYLPVDSYSTDRVPYDVVANDDNKIGQQWGNVTRLYNGKTAVPINEFDYDQVDHYRYLNKQTGYTSSSKNVRNTSMGFTEKQTNYMALLLKSMMPDLNGKFNKYTVLDALSPEGNQYRMSLDPAQYSYNKEGLLEYSPRRYMSKSDTLTPISVTEAVERLLNMRTSSQYFENIESSRDLYSQGIKDAASIGKIEEDTYDIDALTSVQIKPTKDKLSQDSSHKISVFNNMVYTVKDLDEHLDRNNLVIGTKVVEKRHNFEKEKLMWNNGLKLNSAEDIIQDRNIKQTMIDMYNSTADYSQDLLRLYNYCISHDSLDSLNTYAYLVAAKNKLSTIEKYLNQSKAPEKVAKYKTQAETLLASLNNYGIKGLTFNSSKDIETYLTNFAKEHTTETVFFNKIVRGLNLDASKYSKLTREPGDNIFFLLTNTSSSNADERGIVAKVITKMLGKDIKQSELSDPNSLPLYEGYDFMESMTQSIKSIARTKAIYDNSVRLKQSGVMDNSVINNLLIQTISKHYDTIMKYPATEDSVTALLSFTNIAHEKLSGYLVSDDISGEGTYNRFVKVQNKLKSMLKQLSNGLQLKDTDTIGSCYMELHKILSEVIENSGITYEKALLDTTNISDREAFLLATELNQDMFACLSNASGNDALLKSFIEDITKYADANNLAIVDRVGKIESFDKIYKNSESSLEIVLKAMDRSSKETFEQSLARQAIQGELFFMDKNLAEAYSKSIFIEHKKVSKLKKFIKRSSNLCVKLLMSNPFKLIDRFLKFTAFDATTLGTASFGTFKYEGQSFKELKAYFQSKGAYQSKDLSEFLETQGITMSSDNFDLILNLDPSNSSSLFKKYTDMTGKVFTFQSLSQRYAYWLSAKHALEKGDYSVLGSAFHLKDALKDIEGIKDEYGNTRITKEGQQAAFAMAQMIGSTYDFPGMSKQINDAGFVFTTFPLAALRWGGGELRSMSSAIKGLFTEGIKSDNAKWLFRQSSGLIGTFILEQVLVWAICEMFGVTDDEDEDKWQEAGALPNVTQSIIQNEPIMDTFSSMNIGRELYGLTLEPFFSKDNNDESELSGMRKWIYKNVVSHLPPVIKSVGEVATKKDLIDDQVIDTSEKYNGFENLFRKLSSYVIGGAGANALTTTMQGSDNIPSDFYKGLKNAFAAELGNTKANKENIKNYYNSMSLVNDYIDYSDQDSLMNFDNTFNYARYNEVKKEIYTAINQRKSPTEMYDIINDLNKKGYTVYEIRAALKNCSLGERLNKISDYNTFLNSLTDIEIQNLKTALAYEEYLYPWLEDNIKRLDSAIKENNKSSYDKQNVPYAAFNTYGPAYSYSKTYSTPDYSPNTYSNNNYNYNSYNYNPYEVFKEFREKYEYNQKQAEYASNKKKWSDN